jgi:hypothetical protein
MARAPKNVAPQNEEPKVSQTTAITNWDEELAKQAEAAAGMEASAGGSPNFTVRGGILAFNDTPIPGNQMAVVILDSVLENAFYEGAYDPDNITPPTCFAFGRDEGTMGPHPTVVERDQGQNETCRGCPMNQFGTADKGRGKACGNRRRMILIPAGDLDQMGRFTAYEEPEHFQAAVGGQLKLPPTSVKGYANFVKQVSGSLRRPPHAVFTKVSVVPDQKTQFKINFAPIAAVPNNLIPILMKRHEEAKAMIEVPYNLDIEEQAPAAAPAKGGRGKPAPVANKRPEVKRGAGAAKKY